MCQTSCWCLLGSSAAGPVPGACRNGRNYKARPLKPGSGLTRVGSPVRSDGYISAHRPCRIQPAAFSAIMSVGALVLPLVMVGMAPASTTRKPLTPRTFR